jgi:hypothetical protein
VKSRASGDHLRVLKWVDDLEKDQDDGMAPAAKAQSTNTPLALIGAAHFSISLLTKCLR